jgi:hypothetical protein
MQKDLFQIAQMSDIYATLSQWAMLSPRLSHELSTESHGNNKDKTGRKVESNPPKKYDK